MPKGCGPPSPAELPGELVRVVAEVEAEEGRGGDQADHHQQRGSRFAQAAGPFEDGSERGPQRFVDETARHELRQHAAQRRLGAALRDEEQRQRQQEASVDPEVLEQRLRHRARQQAALPDRVDHQRHPGDRDRDRDAASESKAALPRNQPDRLLGAVQRVVGEERKVLRLVGAGIVHGPSRAVGPGIISSSMPGCLSGF
jgi:hypothetical protein